MRKTKTETRTIWIVYPNTRTGKRRISSVRILVISALTTSVPFGTFGLPFAAQAPLYVGERIAVGRQHFAQQRYVCDGQSESVNLTEPFLVRERRHVTSELIERRVDAAKHQWFIIIIFTSRLIYSIFKQWNIRI